jgi:exonuclease V gamma subunit
VHAWLGRLDELDLEPEARAPLERYLADDPDRRKRGQLARRVARLFVQYQTLRVPELLRWERGEWFGDDPDESGGEIWQRALWNALVDEADRPSLARDLDDGIGRLQRREGIEGLPRRVTLFGLSSVPPVLLSLAEAVARHREVTIATLTPTREYIGDARPARWQPVEQGDLFDAAKVHPLLAEWGRVGRDLQDQLTELEGIHPEVQRETAPERTVLGQLQQDLLDARMPAHADERAAPERVRVRPDDRSLRIHVCHSERREIEVLRDEILRAFEEGVVREPSDVLVLVPDIDRYAPFVRAVFESPRATAAGPVHLPVQVADGRDTDHSDFARFALDLLDHAGGRHTASGVLELLESGPVARRFGLDDVPTSDVHDLVRGAGIRFGRDPVTRAAEHDLPDLDGGTWREGLDRLVLGFALWMYGRMLDLNSSTQRRVSVWAVMLVLVAGSWWQFVHEPLSGEAVAAQQGAQQVASHGGGGTAAWEPFSVAALETAVAEGHTVFVDFTAAWCTTCKVNEKTVIMTEPVLSKIEELGVKTFVGDWTNRDEEITRVLRQFGRSGVPFYAVFPAGRIDSPIVLPEIITQSMVVEALEEAGPSRTVASR